MKKQNHTHKLVRYKYKNGTVVYHCLLNCTFKSEPALLIGKVVLCNRCEKEFTMGRYELTLKEPHCPSCHNRTKVLSSKVMEEESVDLRTEQRRQLPDRRDEITPEKLETKLETKMESIRKGITYVTIDPKTEDDFL